MMFQSGLLRRSLPCDLFWLVACLTFKCLGVTVQLDYQHDTFFTSHPTAKAAVDAARPGRLDRGSARRSDRPGRIRQSTAELGNLGVRGRAVSSRTWQPRVNLDGDRSLANSEAAPSSFVRLRLV